MNVNEKWPRLRAEDMDYGGAKALASSILFAAASDYFDVCDHPQPEYYPENMQCTMPFLKTKFMIEKFFDSELFFVLSDVDKRTFMNTIKQMKKDNIPFPRSIKDIGRMVTAREMKKEKTA